MVKRLYLKKGEYELNPKHCLNCKVDLDFEKRHNKFCSQSCSATYNNKNRGPHTNDVKIKIRNSKLGKSKYPSKYCALCNKKIKHDNKTGYCKKCIHDLHIPKIVTAETKKLLSDKAKLRYLEHPEKHPNVRCSNILESYPEKYFRLMIENHGLQKDVDYVNQYRLGNFYVDFYFPKINLGVEIDGEQWHDRSSIKEIERENKILEQIKLKRFWSKKLIKKEYETDIIEIINSVR